MTPTTNLFIDYEDDIPTLDDLYEYEDIEDDIQDDIQEFCFACHGTGEGHSPDGTCSYCKGSGVQKIKKP